MKKSKVIARQATKIEELEQALKDAQQDMILFNRQQQVGQHGLEAVIEEQKAEIEELDRRVLMLGNELESSHKEFERASNDAAMQYSAKLKALQSKLDKSMQWAKSYHGEHFNGTRADVIYRLKDENGEIVYSTDPNNPEMTVAHYLILTDPDGEK